MIERKVALLGMPGYGQLSAGAAQGYYRASRGPDAGRPLQMHSSFQNGSLLAQNFNALWCMALNLRHNGEQLDYFAMLHSDVEPQLFWLDLLIEEMEQRDLDVLGVVVPIKDQHGLTSIALDHPGGGEWLPKCRLTMHEIFQLPETFTSEDVGYPVLLNTGCWVCRFDPEWAKKVRFTINDRIIFSESNNRYEPQVEPEDWYFSRLCNEIGLKIGATRKIRLLHHGVSFFPNTRPWGDMPFDTEYLNESVVKPREDADGFLFPADVDGWLMREEGKALAELARGKRVLEIGSYCGRSTICMAQTAESVASVDPHDGRGTPKPKNTRQELAENLKRYGCENVSVIVGTVEDNGPFLYPPFDLVFIDGAHDYESVKRDIENAMELLAPDGTIAFHDYREHPGEHDGRWDEGVTLAVREFIADGAELIERRGTIAVVRPPALVEV